MKLRDKKPKDDWVGKVREDAASRCCIQMATTERFGLDSNQEGTPKRMPLT